MKSVDDIEHASIGEFDQAAEMARLIVWLQVIEAKKPGDLTCLGVRLLVHNKVLRFANWPTKKAGFLPAYRAIAKSDAIVAFTSVIWPLNRAVAAMLDLLADARILMRTGLRDGKPELIFFAAA